MKALSLKQLPNELSKLQSKRKASLNTVYIRIMTFTLIAYFYSTSILDPRHEFDYAFYLCEIKQAKSI